MRTAALAALACCVCRAASQQAGISLGAGAASAAATPAWQQFGIAAHASPQLQPETSGEFAGLLRIASGPLPGTDATCAFGSPPIFGATLPSGGARTRVSVYGSGAAFGGAAARSFYLALPLHYAERPRPLLLALHGGLEFAQAFLSGACPKPQLQLDAQ